MFEMQIPTSIYIFSRITNTIQWYGKPPTALTAIFVSALLLFCIIKFYIHNQSKQCYPPGSSILNIIVMFIRILLFVFMSCCIYEPSKPSEPFATLDQGRLLETDSELQSPTIKRCRYSIDCHRTPLELQLSVKIATNVRMANDTGGISTC